MQVRRRFGVLVVAAVLLAGLGLLGPIAPARAAACPPLPVDLKTLIAIEQRGAHPLSDRYPRATWRFTEPPATCYGDATIRFTAFLAAPEGIGGASAYQIEPRWIMAESFVAAGRPSDPPAPESSFFVIAVPPSLAGRFDALDGHWVRISGHFHAAAADDCVVVSGAPPDAPPADVAIDICRTAFVLTSIRAVADLPATDADATGRSPGAASDLAPLWLWMIGLAAWAAAYRTLARRRR